LFILSDNVGADLSFIW